MTSPCTIQQRGSVELFFYDELDLAARDEMVAHLRVCGDCAGALGDLNVIRKVLAGRPDVSAPPAGDWSGFTRRLDAAILRPSTSYTGLLATAALLAIVALGVYVASRGAGSFTVQPANIASDGGSTPVATTGMKAVGAQHLERSKLVVLGLASKEAGGTPTEDWAYERELATSLLKDTRLYRLAAEERGLTSLAGVMRDLELVLLETSMAEGTNQRALGQIQRIIEKRGLIEKMDAVPTVGM